MNKYQFFGFLFILLLQQSCTFNEQEKKPSISSFEKKSNSTIQLDSSKNNHVKIHELEESMINANLINIKTIDSTILVNLKYSSTDNFLNTDVYGDLENCYLQKDVAEKLAIAQLLLKSKLPYYSLIVYDGARPRKAQQIMWNIVKVAPKDKTKYLSNPLYGSLHNYGAAVDLSIVNETGKEIDMGTPYDYFGELAHPEKEETLLKEGKLTMQQITNRKLLRNVMVQSGFFPLETEWWHFNSCTRSKAAEKYKIIE